MLSAIRRYLRRRSDIRALALSWSDSIAAGLIDVTAYNRRRRDLTES